MCPALEYRGAAGKGLWQYPQTSRDRHQAHAPEMTSTSFLAKLEPGDRAALEARWAVRTFSRDDEIIGHDQSDRDVYFVLEGRARATIFSEGGKAVAYRDIEVGGIFGELAGIDGKPRSANVVALGPVRVATLSQATFREIVEARPGFAWALLSHMAGQVRRMTERVYEFSTLVGRKRLIRELLRRAQPDATREGQLVIAPVPTHFDLAAAISTHREAVSREMSALGRRGLVERRGSTLVLLDRATLERLCSDDD